MAKKNDSAQKLTLADFSQSCGQCYYCHEVPENKKQMGCYVSPPEYAYGETDVPDFLDFKPIKVTRPACEKFKPKNGGN